MKIVAVDIDGVLADYPNNWIDWLNSKNNGAIKYRNLKHAKLAIGYSNYKNLKKEFRETGQEFYAPLKEGAYEFMQSLSKKGYCIVLLTARPLFEIKQVLYDTIEWLKKHELPYHLIFQGKDKHIKLMKYFKEIEFIVEDNHMIANQIAAAGFHAYLVNNIYNKDQELHENVKRVKSLEEIKC